jgi:two-component system sensor histidine kinase UhpB
VRLAAPAGRLVLQVSDDGRGLGDGPVSGGGIRGMRERGLTVGGRLLLGVGDRGGLEVELDVPLPVAGEA